MHSIKRLLATPRLATRALHTTRTARGGAAPAGPDPSALPKDAPPEYRGEHFLGTKPRGDGKVYKKEGWEYIWGGTLVAATVILYWGLGNKQSVGIKDWAREEALAREADRAAAAEKRA